MRVMAAAPMAVVETGVFVERANRILEDSERFELIAYLASNPQAGQLIPGTGGARKLRWGLAGRGKRGGARTIYYFHSETVPLFLLDIYAKNERANLTEADKNTLRRLLPALARQYGKRS